MGEILVVAEHRKQELADTSREMLSKGRQLASQWNSKLHAVVIGNDTEEQAAEIAKWADKTLVVKDTGLVDGSQAETYQKILSPVIKERNPTIVLIAHSSFGMDLAPALAVELGVPLATDCIDILMEDGKILVKRSIYNGKVNALYSFVPCGTVMVTGRVGQFPIEGSETKGEIERIDSPVKERLDYKRFEGYIEPGENGEIDITKSDILVSVGRGIKSKESIAVAEELAGVLGGDLACTRPVSDNDWLPKAYHVGLSGKSVKPKVYLALGISGAFQHVVGIDKSDIIVAINKDPKAPIFNVADYGIVNDLFEVVPPLIQTIREMISAQN